MHTVFYIRYHNASFYYCDTQSVAFLINKKLIIISEFTVSDKYTIKYTLPGHATPHVISAWKVIRI